MNGQGRGREESSTSFNELSLSLHEFLECYPPPQIGKLLEGLKVPDALDIQRGSILEFNRKVNPEVPLSFLDSSWGGENWIKVTVPLEFHGKFRVLPYDPESQDESVDHIFHTVEDLVKAFPVYVQANASYGNIETAVDKEPAFKCGDRLKLIRLVYDDTYEKKLECHHVNEGRLMRLPMHCEGDFTVVPDNNSYLLADLIALPSRRRRVKIAEDSVKVPGLPSGFTGDLFVEEPDYFIEACLIDDPNTIIGIPHNLDMTLNPDYAAMLRGELLNNFATNNSNLFPVVARVTDWDEETYILENHFVKPGVELVIHGWTRQSKILAKAGDDYYGIPLTYQGRFRIKPQVFNGVSELEKAHPAYKVRVVDVFSNSSDSPISPRDILRIRREDSMKRLSKSENPESRFLKAEKFDKSGRHKVKDVKIPMNLDAVFEEVLEDMKASEFQIRELVNFVQDQELTVDLVKPSPDQRHELRDLPTLRAGITLCDYVVESAVYVSVEAIDAPAFHIPLRTLIYVQFLEQLEKAMSPLLTKQNPKLSTMDRCVEKLPEEVYIALAASKQGGPEFPRFKGATAFGPSSAGWQKDVQTNESRSQANQQSHLLYHNDTVDHQQNLLKPPSPQELQSPPPPKQFEEFSFGVQKQQGYLKPNTPVQNGETSRNGTIHKSHIAVAHSNGGIHSQFANMKISSNQRSISSENLHENPPLQPQHKYQQQYHSHHNMTFNGQQNPQSLEQNQQSLQPPPGYTLVPQSQVSQQQYQPPPGYTLVPIQQPQQPQIPPGFMLVPVQNQNQSLNQPLTLANLQQMAAMGTLPSGGRLVREDSDDSDIDDAMTDISKFTFSSKASFKVAIPPDGNLYNFSSKKMAELFRQLKIEEIAIKKCLKDKIDGKKFARMLEGDLEHYGIFHPVVLHFRRCTMKKRHNFQL